MHGFQMDFIQQLDEKKIPQIAGYTKEFVIQIADDSYDSSLTAWRKAQGNKKKAAHIDKPEGFLYNE